MPHELIMIVDDNPANLKLAEVVLSVAGFKILTAVNAEQALQNIVKFRPRLILMDIQLPGIDGLECTRIIKSDPVTKDIIVVALTSYAMKGDEEKALRAGCNGYLTKPIDTRTLAEIVEGYLRRGSNAGSAG